MTDRPDWMAPKGRPWASSSTEVAFDNPWLALTLHDATAPTGAPARYAAVRYKNLAIGILPLFDDGTLVLVGQHRFPLMDYSWELPEGGAPLDEDALDGAKRELREEAGLEAAQWREILAFQLSNSVTDERGHVYLATGLTAADCAPDPTEDLQLARVAFRVALDLALRGEIKDMITLAALLRAYHMAREGELDPALARAMLGEPPQ
jgi:8-oxo-dGTP pyrophosphatase MutT (NUDIX family)